MRATLYLIIIGLLSMIEGPLLAQSDGLYWTSDVPTNLSMTTASGDKVFIGQAFTEKIDEVDLVSTTNDNSKFQFFLHQHKDYVDCPALVFVFQGHCLVVDGRGGGKGETLRNTVVSDPADIARISAFFRIEPKKRIIPEQQLEVKLVVKKEGYTASGPVEAEFRITNKGSKAIVL